jgi:hypothetical protein
LILTRALVDPKQSGIDGRYNIVAGPFPSIFIKAILKRNATALGVTLNSRYLGLISQGQWKKRKYDAKDSCV